MNIQVFLGKTGLKKPYFSQVSKSNTKCVSQYYVPNEDRKYTYHEILERSKTSTSRTCPFTYFCSDNQRTIGERAYTYKL